MCVAILSAIETEISGVHSLGGADQVEAFGSKQFYLHIINQVKCVSAITSVGKVAAAQTVSALIEKYKPNSVIVIGTAGALHPDARIGDIVIAEKLFQHDVDLRPFRPRFELGITGKTFFHADELLIQSAMKASQAFLNSAEFLSRKAILNTFGITTPKILKGIIATGDVFFSDHYQAYKKELLAQMPDVLAAEMEGAAIAQVCDDLNIPFVVIRFISDNADGSASINYLEFLNTVAAWYGKEMIRHML